MTVRRLLSAAALATALSTALSGAAACHSDTHEAATPAAAAKAADSGADAAATSGVEAPPAGTQAAEAVGVAEAGADPSQADPEQTPH